MENTPKKEKKKYDIPNNDYISSITIIPTTNAPETRVYFSANYSPKEKSIICIGGVTKDNKQYEVVTTYNPNSNKWKIFEDVECFDVGISGHIGEIITEEDGEKLLIFGGLDNHSDYNNHLYIIPTSNFIMNQIDLKVNKKGVTLYPPERAYHTSNYDEQRQKIYIYGGTDMNITNSKTIFSEYIWEYDINYQNWDKIILTNPRPFGAPRGHTSVLYEGKLIIFGGVVLFKKFTNDFYSIDLANKTIEDMSYSGEPPSPVAFHSMTLINKEYLLIYGGLNHNYNPVNSLKIYDLINNTFIGIDIPLLPKIFGHKLVFDDDKKLYIIGGMDDFKYVGDESVIKKDEENEQVLKSIEDKIEYNPMSDIFEIELNITK